jgi:hypothetical protein
MTFFFRLHTPVPGDLDSPSKFGRALTGSSWRLPMGPEAVRARRLGGVMRERRLGRWIAALASANRFVAPRSERSRSVMGGRRFALVVGSFSVAILAAQLCMTPARAQQTPANFFEPAIAKKFPPARKTLCAGCGQEQTALNKAWGDLNNFDKKTNGDFRKWFGAVDKLYNAEKALGGKKKQGGDTTAEQKAVKNAEGQVKAEATKLNNNPAYQYEGAKLEESDVKGVTIHKTGELMSELTEILGRIEDAAAALEKCEKNPANCPKPAAGPGAGGGIIPGGGGAVTPGGKKLPAIPACKDQNFLDQLEDMLQEVKNKLGVGGHGLEGQLKDMEENDPNYSIVKKAVDDLKAERAAIETHKAAAERKWKENKEKCDPPKKTSMIFPGSPLRPTNQTYAVTFAGDSTAVCTFDDGTSVPAPIAFADDAGNPLDPDRLAPTEIIPPKTPETPPTQTAELPPKTPETPPTQTTETPPKAPETPPTQTTETPPKTPERPPTQTTETPPKTPETPPTRTPEEPPKTPETPPTQTTGTPPKTPETPPTQTTTDIPPPSIPDTVFVKAKESVLEGSPPGNPLQGQTVKLLPPNKPDLPGSPESKTARDTGFDKPPAQCTTTAEGECKIAVLPDDRDTYGLPALSNRARQNYRIDVDVRKTSEAIVEITGGRPKPDVTEAPAGTDLFSEPFRSGDRIYARIKSLADKGIDPLLRRKFDDRGSNFEEDYCREKQPGPPLGTQPTFSPALYHELPAATVKLWGAPRRSTR